MSTSTHRIGAATARVTFSKNRARRIALAAQGFGRRAVAEPTKNHIRSVIDRIGLLQIDSVNVLCRSQYLPVFARLGRYDPALLDRLHDQGHLVEYWAHEASLITPSTRRLLRWRMDGWRRHAWDRMRPDSAEYDKLLDDVYAAVADSGPITARVLNSQLEHDVPENHGSEWGWNWSQVKTALEALFWAGTVSTAGRTRQFERRYDLTARVVPDAGDEPLPVAEAMSELVRIAARAHGIASAADLRDYFRLPAADTKTAIGHLVATGELIPAAVPGWSNELYLHCEAAKPRRIGARALLSPFDSLVFTRRRAELLFDFHYRNEIYTPKPKRRYGYYVLPFLLGDRLVARVDLKADRATRRLLVRSAHPEDRAPASTAAELSVELRTLAAWLGLDRGVTIDASGPLASQLSRLADDRHGWDFQEEPLP